MPAHTPLPMPASFPFQLSRGIHTSTLISESGVGVRVACTRQKAGVFLKTAIPPGPPIMKPPAGGLNWPASTMDAEVILPSFNLRDVRLPHVSAARAGIAFIFCCFRIGAQRAGSYHLSFIKLSGNYPFRNDPLLTPVYHVGHGVILVRTNTTAAVGHPWYHEEPEEIRCIRTVFNKCLLVILYTTIGWRMGSAHP